MQSVRALFLAGLFLVCACATAPAQKDPAARDIDRFVEKTLAAIPDVPSLGIAVVRNGQTLYLHENQTSYYIASSTKSFTGLACAILAGRGLIDLDAPVTRYLPESKLAPEITLRKFLTHTSGIQNDAIVFRTAFSGEHTQAGLIELLASSKPGKTGFRYTNLGYVVASLVIERVTGKPWQQVVDELIFAPLGMNHTTAYMSKAQRLATPYHMDASGRLTRFEQIKSDSRMHAAGGIVTTPEDLARWLKANIDGSFEARAVEEAHRMQVPVAIERDLFKSSGYALGWYDATYDGDRVLFQLGEFEGWRTHVSFMPERKIGVAVLTNTNGPGSLVAEFIAEYVYDRLRDKPDVERVYEERLARLKERVAQIKAGYVAEMEKRAQRPRTLQHEDAAYAGRYFNPLFGTVTIADRGGRLAASIGDVSSELQPFTEPETARVELAGAGEVFRFSFGSEEKAESLRWHDEVFRRLP